MIIYPSRLLTRGEVWFDEEPGSIRSVDWILHNLCSRPAHGARWRHFHNYVIDLTQSTEHLLKRLNEDTAYKIRRARDRDKITCECCDPRDPAVLDRFEDMYNPFAAIKGLAPLNRARMNAMATAGALDLSAVKDQKGNTLGYHANYRGHRRATELYLPSLYCTASDSAARNLIGRANRYLTWSDILRYKEQGLESFDFGGWYPGTADQVLLRINNFKRGFGGQVVREYECEQIVSTRGWAVLTAARLLKRARLIRSGSKSAVPHLPPAGAEPAAAAPSA